MPTGIKEDRTPITRSVLVRTNEMIEEIARKRQCGLANVIDLAVAELHAKVMGSGEGESAEQSEPSLSK